MYIVKDTRESRKRYSRKVIRKKKGEKESTGTDVSSSPTDVLHLSKRKRRKNGGKRPFIVVNFGVECVNSSSSSSIFLLFLFSSFSS